MVSIEDILSNPGSSCFYLNHRFFYAIGNTPAVDLTEGCDVPSDTAFLLLGCGDIRNILQTVLEVSQIKCPPRSLMFHVNDIDDVLLARIAVLTQIVNTIDPNNQEDVEFIWNVWYNLHLSERHFRRLKSILSDILENPLGCLKFESENCKIAIKAVIKYWLKMRLDVSKVQLLRESFIRQKVAADSKQSVDEISFSDAVEGLFTSSRFSGSGLIYNPANVKEVSKIIKSYYRTGSTCTLPTPYYTNATFLCPHVNGWRVHPGVFPHEGFNEFLFDENLSLTEHCIGQLRAQLQSWTTYTRSGGIIQICLWDGDALSLCNRTMPSEMKFHFINTSNLCDHINLLNVLLACSKRLKRSGILSIQTLNWSQSEYGSIENFLEEQIGIPSSLYPTFLGLHLGENFELGTSKRPNIRLSSAVNTIEMKWVAARVCRPGIDISKSCEVQEILVKLAKRCFKILDPANEDPLKTPLTLIYLMKQLAINIKGGVQPLLDIVEKCLPERVTKTGQTFLPLWMEWKTLKLFHLSDDLSLTTEDTLVEVRVPVELVIPKDLIGLTPAGLGIPHTAIITNHATVFPDFAQATEPWIALTAIFYDYKTGIVNFAVPKSESKIFSEAFCLNLVTFNISPPLLASRSLLNTSAIHNVAFEVKSKPNEKQTYGLTGKEDEVTVVLSETTAAYRLDITAAKQNSVLQSLKVQADCFPSTKVLIKAKISTDRDIDLVEIQVQFSCPVRSPMRKQCTHSNTVELIKSADTVQGPTILPFRRQDISAFPRYSASRRLFDLWIGTMFTSDADKRIKCKEEDRSALFKLKETIQIFLQWALDPPPHHPLVRAYRILRNDRPGRQLFGYFHEDIFVGVRRLHSFRGIPTLDVVWLDFEFYREMVPYKKGLDSEDAIKFLDENAGMTRETFHFFAISVEEAILLKKILRMNTLRSVQKLDGSGSPRWRFNSFIQPLYSIEAELELFKSVTTEKGRQTLMEYVRNKTGTSISLEGSMQPKSPESTFPRCKCCGISKADLRKCSRCKTVWYCDRSCQEKDWKSGHKRDCSNTQPTQVSLNSACGQQHGDIKEQLQSCEFCGKSGINMKKCSRCKSVFYCGKKCQEQGWKAGHRNVCRPVL